MNRIFSDARDRHRAPRKRPQGQKVACSRSIGFHTIRRPSAVCSARHPKARRRFSGFDAKVTHHAHGHFHIGAADEFALDVNPKPLFGSNGRRKHQQGRQILARDIAAHAYSGSHTKSWFKRKRQKAFVDLASDLGAETSQSLQQIADRTLAHTRNAINSVVSARKSQKRRQRSGGSTGITDKEFPFFDGNPSPAPRDGHLRVIVKTHRDAERLKRIKHAFGVVCSKQSGERRFALGHRRQKQSTIGNRFAPWQLYDSCRGRDRRDRDALTGTRGNS